jgi:hypothetical protein
MWKAAARKISSLICAGISSATWLITKPAKLWPTKTTFLRVADSCFYLVNIGLKSDTGKQRWCLFRGLQG